MSDANPPEREVGPLPTLKEVFLQATYTPGGILPDSITAIDLGIFAEEGRELARLTQVDPRHREFLKLITIINKTRKLRIYKAEVGEEDRTPQMKMIYCDATVDPRRPKHERMAEIKVAGMHTHPIEISPSGDDIMPLILGDEDPRSVTAVFVVAPTRFILAFRGSKTPHLTLDQVQEKRNLWEKQMAERIRKFVTSNTSRAEQIDMNERARTQLLHQIAEKYDLKVFTGDINQGVVRLQFQ